jgi:hypothetical protein
MDETFGSLVVDETTDISTINQLSVMQDSLTKVYLEFLIYVLNLLSEFNTTFPSEVPQVHTVK